MGSSSPLFVVKGLMSGITMFSPNKNSQRSGFLQLFDSWFTVTISSSWYTTLFACRSHQEYIVEDRDCKNVPELDQSHVMELRMLGLY